MAETQIALRETIKSPMPEMLSVNLKANATPGEVMRALTTCCDTMKKIEVAAANVYMVTGQVLMYARKHKSYEGMADGFRDFLNNVVPKKFGLKKTKAYEMIRFVEIFEEIPIKELLPYSITALNRASFVIKKSGDADPAYVRKTIKQAVELPPAEFLDLHKAEAHGGVGKSIIRVATTHKVKRDFDRRMGDANREDFFKWLNSADEVWALWEAHLAKE